MALASASFETSALTKVASPPAARTSSTVSCAGRLAELRDDDLGALRREQLGGDAAHPAARRR